MRKLRDLAVTIRSKNAGVNQVTFDVIFPDPQTYQKVKRTKALTRESVLRLFNIAPERVSDFIEFDAGNAIKFTIYRQIPSGSPGDWDVLGCQQYGPLLEVEVPWD